MKQMKENKDACCIGVISDTHGHISAQLVKTLKRVDMIIHAGDMDDPDVVDSLRELAPLICVRGNMDTGKWAKTLCPTELVNINEMHFYVLHDIYQLDIDPESINIKAVISGHTHRPSIQEKNGVIYLNPGSASFPRNGHAPSMAIIRIHKHKEKELDVRFIELCD